MPFLTILLEHKEFLLILVLLIGIFLGFEYIKDLHADNIKLKNENILLATNLQTSNDSIKTLTASLATQNAAVDQLKNAADVREQANAIEIAKATAKADTYHQQAIDILKVRPSSDLCKSANDLINSEIIRNGKK